MKKYIYIIMIIFITIILFMTNKSYAYQNCELKSKMLSGVNTNDISLIEKNTTIQKICSYQDCYNVKESNMKDAINNFLILQKKNKSEDYSIEANTKGIPITEITYYECR